jgi:hypothetical protein
MTALLSITWLPPDGTGNDAVLLIRRLLRRAAQEQPTLPDPVCPPGSAKLPNQLPDCGSERLASALGFALLRETLLSLATTAPPTTDLRLLAERGVVRPQLAFRDPVKAVCGILGRGPRGRPGRGLPGAGSAAEAIALLAASAEAMEAWLEVPQVLAVDLDRLSAAPAEVLPLVMAQLGLVPDDEAEVPAFLADWGSRKSRVAEADAEAAILSAEEEAEVRRLFGPLHARCIAAAKAAAAALAGPPEIAPAVE